MEFNSNAQLDSSLVRSGGGGRGGMGGGGIAIGGIGGIVVLVLALLLGANPNDILGSVPEQAPPVDARVQQECRTGQDAEENEVCRYSAYMTSLSSVWGELVSGHQPAHMQVFTGHVSTGCGAATSEVGPFYCPADANIYLDTAFFAELQKRFGAKSGRSTEAYVVAHEYGHHIQNLTGQMRIAQRDRSTGPDSASVRLEVQADCYAGVWLRRATEDPKSPIKSITRQDMLDAIAAAQAVGDDNIQERATGRVDREAWTHGSSEARQRWLTTGYETGDPRACDTFAADARVS